MTKKIRLPSSTSWWKEMERIQRTCVTYASYHPSMGTYVSANHVTDMSARIASVTRNV